MKFTTDGKMSPSHCMKEITITRRHLINKIGKPTMEEEDSESDYTDYIWEGDFTDSDGTTCRASVWSWKGSLNLNSNYAYASVWVEDVKCLNDFIYFLQR